jgi:sugar phosphate isomerase/epimerase
LKLAFSTSVCPDWTWTQIIGKARELGFDGVEWRLDPASELKPDLPDDLAREIGDAVMQAGLGVPALDASVEIPIKAAPERDAGVTEVRRWLETASAMRAERLVVVPGEYGESVSDAQANDWLCEALTSLHETVKVTGVQLALDLRRTITWDRVRLRAKTCSSFLNDALWRLQLPGIGVQWDVSESYREGERADQAWEFIWPWFSYLQLKDMVKDGPAWRTVPLGSGTVPISFALKYVGGPKYIGWVSLNWDRLEEPGLAPADDVLPAFLSYINDAGI